jgi:hypothetical protein
LSNSRHRLQEKDTALKDAIQSTAALEQQRILHFPVFDVNLTCFPFFLASFLPSLRLSFLPSFFPPFLPSFSTGQALTTQVTQLKADVVRLERAYADITKQLGATTAFAQETEVCDKSVSAVLMIPLHCHFVGATDCSNVKPSEPVSHTARGRAQ